MPGYIEREEESEPSILELDEEEVEGSGNYFIARLYSN
jgi:hypothetical protein